MTQAQRETIYAAFIELGKMGGNMTDSPYRTAWLELRSVLAE